MICPNCGREVTGKFCPACGTKLNAEPAAPQANNQGYASNQNQTYASNQDNANPGYSSNQGYGNQAAAPNRGYQPGYGPNQGYGQNQPYNSGFAYNQNFNPGYVPNQGFNPGQQVTGDYQGVPASSISLSPGAQLLRRHAGSPLMLICAILMTLAAGCISYVCGKSVISWLDGIGRYFDRASDYEKISIILNIAGCVLHIVMIVWLTIDLWVLFGSAASVSSLKACRSFFKARMGIFVLLTLSALIMLVAVIVKEKGSTSDFVLCVSQLTNSGVTHVGYNPVKLLFKDTVPTVILICVLFLFGVIRSALLTTVCSSSIRMLCYGGPQQRRVAAAGVLSLLSGLALMACNIYMLAEYGKGTENILYYASLLACGLVSFLCSILLFMNASGVRRMRGI